LHDREPASGTTPTRRRRELARTGFGGEAVTRYLAEAMEICAESLG